MKGMLDTLFGKDELMYSGIADEVFEDMYLYSDANDKEIKDCEHIRRQVHNIGIDLMPGDFSMGLIMSALDDPTDEDNRKEFQLVVEL